MKFNYFLILILGNFSIIYGQEFSDANLNIPGCTELCKSKMVISTGYNPVTNNAYAPNSVDDFWKITASTTTLLGCIPPCSSTVIDRTITPGYLMPDLRSNWISYNTNYNLVNAGTITFERVFYVNQDATIFGGISLACDNECKFSLSGPSGIILTGGYPENADINFKKYKPFEFKAAAKCGQYILKVQLRNVSGYTALNVSATVKSDKNSLSNNNGCCLKCQ